MVGSIVRYKGKLALVTERGYNGLLRMNYYTTLFIEDNNTTYANGVKENEMEFVSSWEDFRAFLKRELSPLPSYETKEINTT